MAPKLSRLPLRGAPQIKGMQPTSHTGTVAPGSFSAQGLWAPLFVFFHPFSHLPGCSSPWAMSCDPKVAVGWQLYPLLCPLGRCPPPFPLMEKGLLIYFPCYYSEDSQRYKSANRQSLFWTNENSNYNYALLLAFPSEVWPLRFYTFTGSSFATSTTCRALAGWSYERPRCHGSDGENPLCQHGSVVREGGAMGSSPIGMAQAAISSAPTSFH